MSAPLLPRRSAPPRPSPPRRSSTRRCARRSLTPSVTLRLLLPSLATTARGRLMPRLRLIPSTSPTLVFPLPTLDFPLPTPSLPPLLWLTPLLRCPLPTLLPTPSPRP